MTKIYSCLILTFVIALCSCAQQNRSCHPGKWMEIPAVETNDSSNIVSLHMKVDGKLQRNYTFCWNIKHMTADWVAYPLCKSNIGKGKRSNAFGLCPYLPASEQPLLLKGYRRGNGGNYSRGHQIPSADRLEYKANVQTFYGVNMTPQEESMNGGIWAVLENRVREWSQRCDTLYVVSGCLYDNGKEEYVLDNDDKKIYVPDAYYKALLMRKGHEFHACGFILENRPYHSAGISIEKALSLKELENRTGLKFFPLLEDETDRGTSVRIRNEIPANVDFWGKGNGQ